MEKPALVEALVVLVEAVVMFLVVSLILEVVVLAVFELVGVLVFVFGLQVVDLSFVGVAVLLAALADEIQAVHVVAIVVEEFREEVLLQILVGAYLE